MASPSAPTNEHDTALWIAFDESGMNSLITFSMEGTAEETQAQKAPPFLVIGYSNGVQVWDIRDANVCVGNTLVTTENG